MIKISNPGHGTKNFCNDPQAQSVFFNIVLVLCSKVAVRQISGSDWKITNRVVIIDACANRLS